MDTAIAAVNTIQDACALLGDNEMLDQLQLPEIVVAGAQSVGKSSVIEHIVGQEILPRGQKLVTRCIILLHLHHVPLNSPLRQGNDCDWVTFKHERNPKPIHTDFTEVRKEIKRQTDILTGSKTSFSNNAVILDFYSHKVLDLTLVDTPGIVKVPVENQPADIENITTKILQERIRRDKALILAVAQAEADVTTSDGVKQALLVDPERARTILVITRMDNMGAGTKVEDVLANKDPHFPLGRIGVVNRSQLDIDNKVSIEKSLEKEDKFFKEKCPAIANQHGTRHLALTLNKILVENIKKCSPIIKKRLQEFINKKQSMLDELVKPVDDKTKTMINIVTEFRKDYAAAVIFDWMRPGDNKKSAGARIYSILHEEFGPKLKQMDPTKDLTVEEIYKFIKNCQGIKTSVCISNEVPRAIIRERISQIEWLCKEHVKMVFIELSSVVKQSKYLTSVETRFPKLASEIRRIFKEVLDNQINPLNDLVTLLIDINQRDINLKHSDFVNGPEMDWLAKSVDRIQKQFMTMMQKEHGDCVEESKPRAANASNAPTEHIDGADLLKDFCVMVNIYFEIVRKAIYDLIPKSIKKFLISDILEGDNGLEYHLNRQLIALPDKHEELLKESESTTNQRMMLTEALKASKQAMANLEALGE